MLGKPIILAQKWKANEQVYLTTSVLPTTNGKVPLK